MVENDKIDKKKGAIFRMEEVDGKLYRVMYFKNNKGGLTRSKFIREVNRKVKGPKGKRGRPKKIVQTQQIEQQKPVQHIRRQEQTPRKPGHKYVKPSGATQNMINEWTSRARK